MRTLKQYILEEMPKHYTGEVVYQKDAKFAPISIRNVTDYVLIDQSDDLVFLVHPQQTYGYVFRIVDLQSGKQTAVPVMHLSLRDTPIKNYKQAYNLRVRESFSKSNITTVWYTAYVTRYGGIVSDKEHLQGGKLLWKSFIKKASEDSSLNVSLVDFNTGEVLMPTVAVDTPDEQIWSSDTSKMSTVLVYEKQ
jgi:hypothetical protein